MSSPPSSSAATPLHGRSCEPCRAGAPSLTPAEVQRLLPQAPGWGLEERENIQRLSRGFPFETVDGLIHFQARIMELADQQGHHPVLTASARKSGWKLTVELWTHKMKGLHENDFIMASKINLLGGEGGTSDTA